MTDRRVLGGMIGTAIGLGLIYWAMRPAPRRAPIPPVVLPPVMRAAVRPPTPAAQSPSPAGTVRPPGLTQWLAYLTSATAHGIQLPYVIKWLALESGGNPCSVGYPSAKGPDGLPLEMGIAQFYNPDDLNKLGLTAQELRAYCVAGDQHERVWKGKTIKGFSDKLTRPLTAAEMQRQADATIGLIQKSMRAATADLTAIGAGASWSPSRRDYWNLVKLQHGLPAISRQGLPAVKKHLGRAPNSWSEFRATLDHVKLDPKVEAKYRDDFKRLLDNAEKAGSSFVEKAVA